MTTLTLRADAGPGLGLGHLARCVAYAEEAVNRGWQVNLIGDLVGGAGLRTRLRDLGVPVLPSECFPHIESDVVLIDHYGVGTVDRPFVVSMEDGPYGRRRADVVVDCGLAPMARPDDGSPIVLTGPQFAPLRANVRAARVTRATNSGDAPARVTVVMGGGDSTVAVEAALTALRATGLPLDVLAVSTGEVRLPVPLPEQTFSQCGPRDDLPTVFANSDLVVSAAGVTMLELCCIGVPMAVLTTAGNQRRTYTEAVRQGIAVGLGAIEDWDVSVAAHALSVALRDPIAMRSVSTTAAATVDGEGARRVLDKIAR
ncbi:MAG: spore coat protein [Actinomycetota bacterium]|nr:spore coat protein [Actinomycetota bacterium]